MNGERSLPNGDLTKTTLQNKTLAEQREFLKRLELTKEALELDKQRQDFIAKENTKNAAKNKSGFDGQVLETLRKQAKKNGIDY